MGKRLFRIFEKEIPSKIPSMKGMDLHLILRSKTTYHGKVLDVNASEVVLLDFLHGKHSINISEISEIVYDKVTAY